MKNVGKIIYDARRKEYFLICGERDRKTSMLPLYRVYYFNTEKVFYYTTTTIESILMENLRNGRKPIEKAKNNT